jgi:superfamily II DNA or RNA helicase
MDEQELEPKELLSPSDRLQLQQLRLLEWLDARRSSQPGTQKSPTEQSFTPALPERWELTRGIELFGWQKDCVKRWLSSGGRGTIKVVTGAGKTVLGLAIAETLQRQQDPELRVAVIVPTIVLMNQWYEEIVGRSNLPPEAVGRLGGGFDDAFTPGRRILIVVLATAYKVLPKMVSDAGVGPHLFFIADECHRAGSSLMSGVLATPRAYSLGMSATPERSDEDGEEDDEAGYDESQLGKALGPLVYELNLAQAVSLGVVPEFRINHYGLPLTPAEQSLYDRLTRSISDAKAELQGFAPAKKSAGIGFYKWARSASARGKGRTGEIAARFVGDTSRRKQLIYRIEARARAVREILEAEFEENPHARAILFHESIEEVMNLFMLLRDAGFPVVAEHSDLPQSIREEGLDLFRRGVARVIVSARSLIEGFNVPAADVGIVVASSTSVRQRIQSLGRVLRRHRGAAGEEKNSVIHILYAHNTVDDAIYDKVDWEEITGAESNRFYLWDPTSGPVRQEGPPRSPLPGDTEIDPDSLAQGYVYPGRYEGEEYSCDTRGNVRDKDGRFATNPGELPDAVKAVKGTMGRFRVTPNQQFVIVRVIDGDEWATLYVTRLKEPFEFVSEESRPELDRVDAQAWADHAKPGDIYPFANAGARYKVRYRQRQGGVISKQVPGGEVYARIGALANNPVLGEDAEHLLRACKELLERGEPVSQIEVNEHNHAVYRAGGRVCFVSALNEGLEFPGGADPAGIAAHGIADG